MSTCYLLKYSSDKLTRAQLIATGNTYLCDDSIEEGHTLETTPVLSIDVDGHFCHADIVDDKVTSLATYGVGNGPAITWLGEEFGVDIVSEHDEDWGREMFPVDINTTSRSSTLGEFDVYEYTWNGKKWFAGHHPSTNIFLNGHEVEQLDDDTLTTWVDAIA